MKVDHIDLDKVASKSLDEVVSTEEVEYTRRLVSSYLFSRYERRRAASLARLREYWELPFEIVALEEEGLTWAYITKDIKKGPFIFVQVTENITLEESPLPEDEAEWDRLLNRKFIEELKK